MYSIHLPARLGAPLLLLGFAACAPGDAPGASIGGGPSCQVVEQMLPLPADVKESSGLAESRRRPGIFWTHNDSGGDAELFAVDAGGRLLGKVVVAGAEAEDWEDIAAGPCPAGSCLYVADTGNNEAKREQVDLYRVPEPELNQGATAPAERMTLRYPGKPQDSEAFFVLPDGSIYLVTKGRRDPVELYRVPGPFRAGASVQLQRVSALSNAEPGRINQVTGAAATPDGRRVVIRTYTGLYLFRTADLLAGDEPASDRVDLVPLAEPQGEAVEVRNNGTVFLTSESPGKGEPAALSELSCTLP